MGEGLRHPIALLAIAVLVLNDHVLKAAFPGFLTGKLSDVAGLASFPLVLVAFWQLLDGPVRRQRSGQRPVIVAASVTAIAFALVKTVPAAAAAFGAAIGSAQWLAGLATAPLLGGGLPELRPAVVIVDPPI